MIVINYENYWGDINNLIVFTDWGTGECSTSLISKEHALRALKHNLVRRYKEE